jgi:hypothetical protein
MRDEPNQMKTDYVLVCGAERLTGMIHGSSTILLDAAG